MKAFLAVFSLVVAALLSVWAMLLPPQGEVDSSILMLVAQFLVFAATLLGLGDAVDKIKSIASLILKRQK